jgi:hypothetical protein
VITDLHSHAERLTDFKELMSLKKTAQWRRTTELDARERGRTGKENEPGTAHTHANSQNIRVMVQRLV